MKANTRRNKTPRKEHVSERLARSLWMLQYLQRFGYIDFEIVREAFGISMRSYRRYLSGLQEAGVILSSAPPIRGARYVGFDERLAYCRRIPSTR
jgi:hypothetical protein